MHLDTLTAISPIDGRYRNKTAELSQYFSEYALIKYRLQVEVKWLQFLTEQKEMRDIPKLSATAHTILETLLKDFDLKQAEHVKIIEQTTNHDVKAIEYYLKQAIEQNEELNKLKEFVHFGCTSEDINNITYSLMLSDARKVLLLPAMEKLCDTLGELSEQTADKALLSRTHGQAASPTTMGKEIANFVYRLQRQIGQLCEVPILAKMNGAVGNYNAHTVAYPNIDWPTKAKAFIEQLNLQYNPFTTQIEPHDYIAEFLQVIMRFNTILTDLNRDLWGYISLNYFSQKTRPGEVGSSTMPHKVNPIDFENSEGNLGIANSLMQHLANKLPISRFQRDLTDSTVLRNLGVGLAHSILAYQSTCKGLHSLTLNEEALLDDLSNNWAIIAEPIQTVMRRYGIKQPYEKLKELTQGKQIDKAAVHQFIHGLTLPQSVKEQLLQLTPENYTGYAKSQTLTL